MRERLRHRPHEVIEVWIGRGRRGARREQIEHLAGRHGVAVRAVAEPELRRLVDEAAGDLEHSAHNGFAALLDARSQAASADASEPAADADLVVLLEDIQDPRNLGALLRVCEGAGVARVLLRDRGSAPLTPVVVKASAGASEWLDVERITNTAQQLARLKKDGFWVYGGDEHGEPPWRVDLTGPLVLCVGGEHRGLRSRTRSLCDGLLGLPMRGRVASLNVATALAALLFEAVRQRTT